MHALNSPMNREDNPNTASWTLPEVIGGPGARPSNVLGLDYRREAAALGPPPVPIIDFHAHINGRQAGPIYRRVAELFGVQRVYTMIRLEDAPLVRETLGDFVRFIAFTNFRSSDRGHAFRQGYLDDIRVFHRDFGARILKFWNAPRLREFFPGESGADLVELDSPWRVKQAELGAELGMKYMVHVADPDTWFRTKYSDARVYGKKLEHYRGFEVMLRRFPGPWIAAHMGGSPESLPFLDGLLTRHNNLYLDTSATKWVVRELSAQPRDEVLAFFTKWRGRIIFGSDIVATDEHVLPRETKQGDKAHPMADLADSPGSAAELYASRYFALRTMFETGYAGNSPIADPDLMMVDPSRHGPMSAPLLRGMKFSADLLRDLYRNAATILMGESA